MGNPQRLGDNKKVMCYWQMIKIFHYKTFYY